MITNFWENACAKDEDAFFACLPAFYAGMGCEWGLYYSDYDASLHWYSEISNSVDVSYVIRYECMLLIVRCWGNAFFRNSSVSLRACVHVRVTERECVSVCAACVSVCLCVCVCVCICVWCQHFLAAFLSIRTGISKGQFHRHKKAACLVIPCKLTINVQYWSF